MRLSSLKRGDGHLGVSLDIPQSGGPKEYKKAKRLAYRSRFSLKGPWKDEGGEETHNIMGASGIESLWQDGDNTFVD